MLLQMDDHLCICSGKCTLSYRSFLSLASMFQECRLILNMQRVPIVGADGANTSSDGPPLTTFIEDHRGLSHLYTVWLLSIYFIL